MPRNNLAERFGLADSLPSDHFAQQNSASVVRPALILQIRLRDLLKNQRRESVTYKVEVLNAPATALSIHLIASFRD